MKKRFWFNKTCSSFYVNGPETRPHTLSLTQRPVKVLNFVVTSFFFESAMSVIYVKIQFRESKSQDCLFIKVLGLSIFMRDFSPCKFGLLAKFLKSNTAQNKILLQYTQIQTRSLDETIVVHDRAPRLPSSINEASILTLCGCLC